MSSRSRIAPADMIRADFKVLDARETLRTAWPVEELILLQSVLGHAHEGHGVFRGQRFPNTTMDDIVRALRLNPRDVKRDRQELIDGVRAYVDRAIAGREPHALVDAAGRPLFTCSFLRMLTVAPADVLGGLYLGGLRDDSDVRAEVERERGIVIGGGKCYLVDRERMESLGLDGEELAHGDWAPELPRFERAGLFADASRAGDADTVYQYIRHRRGPGASDDAAIVGAGLLWGPGVAVGVFLADAVDTLEKYVPAYADQDEDIALMIERTFQGLRFTRADVRLLTYVAAAPLHDDRIPDSSLRHLLAVDRRLDLCAVEAHLLEVMGAPTPEIGLSHERAPSAAFYAYVRERVRSATAAA